MAKMVVPIIYFNLGGEMFYVLEDRLAHQKVPKDKANRVLLDILNMMFKDVLMEEIFRPQNVFTVEAMQAVFEKLAHSSILRLNRFSMHKMFDLMFMAFKYQMLNCMVPEDVFLVTLNHLDGIKKFSAITPDLKMKVETVTRIIINQYRELIHLEFKRMYDIINHFLKDYNAKVSLLMKNGLQRTNGELMGPDPEKKRRANETHLNRKKRVEIVGETNKNMWFESLPDGWSEVDGNRGSTLGKDIRKMTFKSYPLYI